MANRWTNTLTERDLTPEAAFLNRRQLMAGAAGLGVVGMAGKTSRSTTTTTNSAPARKTPQNTQAR